MSDPTSLLLNHFPDLTRLPGSILELRKLILQRAVRGELTADWRQAHPDTEPASVLLEKIKAEKARLVKEGEIRKQVLLPEIKAGEVPFVLPEGWLWSRLGEIGAIFGGGTPKSSNPTYFSANGIPWVTPADLYNFKQKYIKRGRRDISDAGLKNSSAQLLPKGSILFSSRAPIGYVAIAANSIATNQGFKSCYPYCLSMNEFIYYFLMQAAEEIDRNASGTTFREVSGKDVSLIFIPLPPLAEQQEIVARVERLLGLCDQMETAHEAEEAVRTRTRRASLAALDGEGDFLALWRTVRDRFPALIRTPEDVRALRKTILQLAVRGRLTADWRRAHPDTEPASVLLEKIKAEKARLVKEGKIMKQASLLEIGKDEVPFALPEGWAWTRLGNTITNIVGGGTPSKNRPEYWDGDIPWASVKDLKSKFLDSTIDTITRKGVESSSTNIVPKGDFLICTRMGLGKISITRIDTAINQDLKAVKLSKYVTKDFFYNFYITQNIQGSGMTVAGIKQIELLSMFFPLPPLAEQQEIVARVERLLGMCDRLEADLVDAGETGAWVWKALGAG